MIRVIEQSKKFYGIVVDITSEEEQENIKIFTKDGIPVILVENLEDLSRYGFNAEDVEMVD